MNYIREINAFYDWLETNSLSTSGIALWHALMSIDNKAGWTAEFAVAVSVLCVKTGLASRTIAEARNELKQKNRIDWRSRRGNQSALYRIIPLCAYDADSGADNSAHKRHGNNLSASHADNGADKYADSYADNRADNGATLNKLNKTNKDNNNSRYAREENSKTIQTTLERSGVLIPSPVEIESLTDWVDQGIELDAVCFAIEKAALAGQRKVNYINGTLKNWL